MESPHSSATSVSDWTRASCEWTRVEIMISSAAVRSCSCASPRTTVAGSPGKHDHFKAVSHIRGRVHKFVAINIGHFNIRYQGFDAGLGVGLEELERGLQVPVIEFHPLATEANKRQLALGQLG